MCLEKAMRYIVLTAFGLLIAAIVLTSYTWQIPVIENYTTEVPYQYKQELVRTQQVSEAIWFWNKVTQVQYIVTNLDTKDGTYTLNFFFDNGTNSSTKTTRVDILAGENKEITMNSPLHGESNISLNVVPPNTLVIQQRTVQKTVNTWNYVPGLSFLLGK
jgi:hypothetical protein